MERLEVRSTIDVSASAGRTSTRFVNQIDVSGQIDERERTILFNSARNCDVAKILSGEVKIDDSLFLNGQEQRGANVAGQER